MTPRNGEGEAPGVFKTEVPFGTQHQVAKDLRSGKSNRAPRSRSEALETWVGPEETDW